MRKYALLCAVLCITVYTYAQTDTTSEKSLEEAVVYSNKFAENKKNLAQKIDIISARTIARFNSQNTGDLLVNSGNIFVQKSQQGGSSPVIRGFEASRVLLVVDGVRMNNAIYRAGHLQNVITIDQNMLERVEVLYGPASTMYGSDGLGGVLHFRTKSPLLSTSGKMLVKGTGFVRFSTANEEKTGHADISIGGKKIAWLQSYTYSDFGDMKMGSNYNSKYPDFGRRSRYIETVNGVDYVRINEDDRVQLFSGYKQWDITQKLLFQPSDKIKHSLNIQYSNSSDVPRYDRLQDIRNFGGSIGTTLRYAEWYYGPQTRLLSAYELQTGRIGFLDAFKLNVNYQDIKESRQQREYRRYDRFDSRREHVKVIGFIADARKVWKQDELNFGFDGQLNDVKSVADRTNLLTGAVTKLDTRYPDGKNKMNYFGIYVQHLHKSKNAKLILNDGIRLQTVSLQSTIVDNSFFKLPVTEIKQTPFAVTGNLGLVYMPAANFRFTGNLSSGFRAPNIDDAVRIFESSTATRRILIPNADINPEYTYNLDIGFSQTIPGKAYFELTGFYTLFRNAIAPAPLKLNGQDSIVYNGVLCAVYASQNVNKAYVRGINARLKVELSPKVSWDNTVSQTFGRYVNPDGSKKPLDHIPPFFGKSSLSYTGKKLNMEVYGMFNGWKRIKDYNPDGEDNGQYATPDGMPGWFTLNWRGSYTVNKYLTVQGGVENIADRNYRYFASGFSAPGRNFILALRASL
ncbi:MAG: TonB-dependent receptor [Bacteroidetes bacterium]|nr:TonB-dependent receptor [Bacteroidota bacterium]